MLNLLSPASDMPADAIAGSVMNELCMDWAHLVRAEYCESPGLSLTEKQVERLWHLDHGLTRLLLTHLTDVGFLRCTPRGAYIRAHVGVD
jgi:hypothetical protein